jgi:hypothetical protein
MWRDGHKGKFCFKRKCEERMAKEWANKDMFNPSHGGLESRIPLPRGKAVVRTIPAWGEKSALGERDPAHRVKSFRPVWKPAKPVWVPRNLSDRFQYRSDQFGGSRGTSFIFVLVMSLGSGLLVMVQMVGMVSLQVVILLDDLHLVLNSRLEGIIALRWRGGTVHGFPFMAFILLQLERVGSLLVVTMVVFVEVALI